MKWLLPQSWAMVKAESWAMVKHIFTASTNPAVSLMLVTEPMDAVNIVTNMLQLLATKEIYEMVVTSKLIYGHSQKLSDGQTYIYCIHQPCCQLNASHRTNGCSKYSHQHNTATCNRGNIWNGCYLKVDLWSQPKAERWSNIYLLHPPTLLSA